MLKLFISFLLKNLIIIHKGTIISKFKSVFILSLIASPLGIIENITNWINENGGYIFFVLMAIAIDHILGSAVHLFIKNDFSIKKNLIGLVSKISLVFLVGILFEGFQFIYKKEDLLTQYLTVITRLMVFLYPAGSAFMNCAIITKGKFPPIGWMEKISKFNKTLNIEQLKNKE